MGALQADAVKAHQSRGPLSRLPLKEGLVAQGEAAGAPFGHLSSDDLIVDRALEAEDRDALDHLPVAERVAELVATSATPMNVALFGAWGSGKSSFAQLLRTALKKHPKVELVTYNAWTFEGESLQRSFISSVANSLGFKERNDQGNLQKENVQFHSGLYERTRSARFNLARDDLYRIAGIAAAVTIAVLILLTVVVAVTAWVVGADIVKQVVSALPSLLPPTAVTALLVTAVQQLVAGARVDVDTSAPTQEQFRERFRALVDRARRHGLTRVVFFIDELDRCSSKQVVLVLGAIRHFFDQPHCIFVIAADRQVIETALQNEPEQATPMNTENPYYSGASEYIDKVFQHQLALPPLRGRRLTRFARNLVEAKTDGLWTELAQPDGSLRDQLVYVLVPSHVRSPRRVKVLLNNFATDYRIAQARGIDARGNAPSIAKLTALRTEFPLFAADLVVEPRLPSLLLDPPDKAVGRLKELLTRHKLPDPELEEGADLTETDPVLAKTDDGEQIEELRRLQRTLLRRYLVRTSQIPDPSRDLLYLEPAGAAVDLADQAFGRLLESEAVEDPEQVAKAAEGQPPEEIRKAIRVLADMVSQEFGPERSNVLTTMLALASQLGYDVGEHGREALAALKVQHNEGGFDEEQLAAALGLALRTERDDHALSEAILADARLMSDADQVSAVATIADAMTKEQRAKVWDAMVSFYPANPEVLDEPLSQLDDPTAKEMLDHPALAKARRTRWNGLTAADAVEEIDDVLDRASARDGDAELIRATLLFQMPTDGSNGYAAVIRHEADLAAFSVHPGFRTATAMLCVRVGPVSDWKTWSRHLEPSSRPFSNQPARAVETAVKVVERWAEVVAASSQDAAVATLQKLSGLFGPDQDADLADRLTSPAQTALGAAAWWNAEASAIAQRGLHQALLTLRSVGPTTASVVSEIVGSDLIRSFAPRPTTLSYQAVRERVGQLDAPSLARVAEAVASATLQPALLEDHALTRIAAAQAAEALGEDAQTAPYLVTAEEMIEYMATPSRTQLLTGWYDLGPSAEPGKRIAAELGAAPQNSERAPVIRWATTLTPAERTKLAMEIVGLANDTSSWIGDLAREPLHEEELVSVLGDRLRAAARASDRQDIARTIAAIRPSAPAAQNAVGQLSHWLFEQGRKADDEAAIILFPALGDRHRMGSRLGEDVAKAVARGTHFSARALDDLRRASIPVRKRDVTSDFWGRFRWPRRR